VRIFGKYRLHELLASGGMADVWRAEVTGAAGVVKEVALKLVRGEHAASSEFVRMFIEEARLAARLGHANVVQVFEFDQVDGRYYIAMELVRGHHLGRVVERARELGLRLGLPRAVHLGAEIARALAHAHRAAEGGRPLGIVHRDVSPHNVLVSFEGEVKLADFGIARAMGQAGLTAPGTVKGKVAYMAPEQGRGEALDARRRPVVRLPQHQDIPLWRVVPHHARLHHLVRGIDHRPDHPFRRNRPCKFAARVQHAKIRRSGTRGGYALRIPPRDAVLREDHRRVLAE